MIKRILSILMIVLLSLSVAILSGCDAISVSIGGDTDQSDSQGNDNNNTDDNKNDETDNNGTADGTDDTDDNKDDPPVPPEPEMVNISLVEKKNGRDTTVATFKIEKGTNPDTDTVDAINGTYYHGYKYASWHYDMYFNNPESLFDPSVILDEDITLYGNRGMLAGENITWSYDNETNSLVFDGDGAMFDFQYNDEPLWLNYKTLAENIVFNGDITNIGDYSFYQFSALSVVDIPDTVERIGKSVFYESSIVDINFPSALVTIDNNAFLKCQGLTELVFNQGLEYVGKSAFYECFGVTRVTLTDRIAEFGASAFFNCTNLKTAYYYGSEEKYDQLVFRLDNFWVSDLANTYFISETAPEEPGPYWYYDENGEIVQWYYTVGFKSDKNAKLPFVFDYVDATKGVEQRNIDFMNSLEYHGYKFQKFECLENRRLKYQVGLVLTKDIHLTGNRGDLCGDNLTWKRSGTGLQINGSGAMWDFESVKDAPWYGIAFTSVNIGNSVTHIGSNAFSGMTSLVSLDIPLNVTSIHKDAFVGCNNLLYIYYMGEDDTVIDGLGELNNLLDAKVYYHNPSSSGEGYFWRMVRGGMEVESKRVAWSLIDGVLTVGGDGALVNYSGVSETPWYPDRENIEEVVILPNANRVGYNSFNGIYSIKKVTVPKSVLKIAANAFTGTEFYSDQSNWYQGGLYASDHLIKVDENYSDSIFAIKDGTISIAENAFLGCTGITELVMNKELLGVYSGALAPLELERIFFTGNSIGTWNGIWNSGNSIESQELGDVTIYCLSVYEPNDVGYYWNKEMKADGTFDIVIWESALPENNTEPEIPEVEDDRPRGNKVGDVCFNYDIKLLDDDNTVSLDSFRGKKLVINLWGVWCPPCCNELPEFSRVAEEYGDSVVVLAVHSSFSSDGLEEYISRNLKDSNIIFGIDTWNDDMASDELYSLLGGIGYYPMTIIVDQTGIITYSDSGALTYDELVALIQ